MDKNPYKPRNSRPLVVGLGFSAGGLDAIGEFLEALPAQRELALVVVPHLDPQNRNLLPGLLSRRTSFAVAEAMDGARLAAGEIQIAPPRATLALARNRLNVVAPESEGERLALIDAFFRSLAQDQGEHAVGIVLSGAGSDGTLGLKAISEAGGMTIAQDPASAGFDSMPASAIAAGVVDHVLAPKAMPAMLLEYARQLQELAASAQGEQVIAEALPRIAEILQQATGHNFLHYKTSTLIRRIRRRMRVTQAASVEGYVKLLAADQPEAHNLFRDLLIGVTAFFRDAEAFDELAREALPRLLRNRGANDPVRFWAPGCATGEEAYSLAIIAREYLAESGSPAPVQVFASDIDAEALAHARAGRYPQGIAESVPPERLQRFFSKRGKTFQVNKEVRELCVFSLHNLISDPPFSKLDLISCRNLLIYLGPHLQKKLIPVFHYALKAGGYLFLGPSESIERDNELFREVDRKHRIWQRRESAVAPNYSLEPAGGGRAVPEPPALNDRDLGAIAHRIVLDEFGPRYAIVNEESQVLYLSRETGKYLEQPHGPFQNNIIRMARQGLRAGLRAALAAAAKTRRKVVNDQISIRVDGARQRVALTVQPMPKLGEDSELLMVVFQDLGAPLARSAPEFSLPSAASEALIEQLERELATTRERLESMVQDLEASREELKASNEELLSMNEELQSANEELQSSKEEVRAANEALSQAHSDLQNLLESTQIGTLFLDGEGTVRGFTPAICRIYNLTPSDIGRPLSHFTHGARRMPPLPDVHALTHAALPIEDEIETEEGVFYMRRVLPYMRHGKPTDGIVITFTEYTALKRASQRIAAVHTMTRTLAQIGSEQAAFPAILDAIRVTFSAELAVLWMLDESGKELRCVQTNAGVASPELRQFVEATRTFMFTPGQDSLPSEVWRTSSPQLVGQISEALGFSRREQAIAARLTSAVAFPVVTGSEFFGVIEFFTGRALEQDRALLDALAAMGHDVGQFLQRVRAEAALREASLRLELTVRAGKIYTGLWDIARDQVMAEPPLLDLFGLALEASPGLEALLRAIDAEDRERVSDAIRAALQSGADYQDEFRVKQRDNSVRWVIARGRVERDASGEPARFPMALVEITEHKMAEQALAEREERYRLAARATNDAIWDWDLATNRIEWNQGIATLFGYSEAVAGTSADWRMSRVHPADRDQVRRGIHDASEKAAEHWADEYQFRRADGSYAHVLDRAYVVRHPQHGAVRMIGAMLDVSARKRLEEALRENARRHQMAASVAGLGDWQLNLVVGVLSSSPQQKEHFGRAPDADFSYGDFWEAVHPEDRERVREAMNRAVAKHEQWQAEFRCVWPDGSVHWIVAVGRPEYTTKGEPVRMFGITRDITRRKTTEEALAKYYAELETRVAERTLQLSASLSALQAESAARFLLQQELQNAEETERRRIGHELHDDLGQRMVSVSFMASLLERKLRAHGMPEAEEAARLAQETRLGIARIRQLAQGMAPPELAAQDLAAALEQLTLNIRKATGIDCVLEADERLSLSDQNVMLQLYRIVQEAINNAVKHGNPSRVQVSCRMQNGALSITVEDNGIGLPPDYATKGLGVRTMQHRAAAIGATLDFSPAESGGAVLTCTLPAGGARPAS